MKKTLKLALALALVFTALLSLTACSIESILDKMPWNKDDSSFSENATGVYEADTTLGNGAKTLTVVIEDTQKSVTFTIHTDKTTVGEALLEHNLIHGEEGAYGLYVKVANGTVADYDVDQSYWAFYVGEDYAMTGVDATAIEEGVTYRLVYTK